MAEFSPKTEGAIADLCVALARDAVTKLAIEIDGLPVDSETKTSMLFTIEISMLNTTLNGMHMGFSVEERLERKLEMLQIIKRNFIKEANDEKEKQDDNG